MFVSNDYSPLVYYLLEIFIEEKTDYTFIMSSHLFTICDYLFRPQVPQILVLQNEGIFILWTIISNELIIFHEFN